MKNSNLHIPEEWDELISNASKFLIYQAPSMTIEKVKEILKTFYCEFIEKNSTIEEYANRNIILDLKDKLDKTYFEDCKLRATRDIQSAFLSVIIDEHTKSAKPSIYMQKKMYIQNRWEVVVRKFLAKNKKRSFREFMCFLQEYVFSNAEKLTTPNEFLNSAEILNASQRISDAFPYVYAYTQASDRVQLWWEFVAYLYNVNKRNIASEVNTLNHTVVINGEFNKNKKPSDGRSSDLTFGWLNKKAKHLECDSISIANIESWQDICVTYINTLTGSLGSSVVSLSSFFEIYIFPSSPKIIAPIDFLNMTTVLPTPLDIITKAGNISPIEATRKHDILMRFLDWISSDYFAKYDNNLVNGTENRFSRPETLRVTGVHNFETNRVVIPLELINKAKTLLCPLKAESFNDWKWAQNVSDKEWYSVPSSFIDKADPDCVYKADLKSGGWLMWSPVNAVLHYLKLNIPLRVYQARMLDSGEADTYKYSNGEWVSNDNPCQRGNKRNPYQKGVINRYKCEVTGAMDAGFWINTNKTADQYKTSENIGYPIPWKMGKMFVWLEKLRNWQAKYNPIDKPLSWLYLKPYLDNLLSNEVLLKRGELCPLFRDPLGRNKPKRTDIPIQKYYVNSMWFLLIEALENWLADEGRTHVDGSRINLIKSRKVETTIFPQHNVRVSLLTHLFTRGDVPLPVLSKLIAGHTRLIMSLFYIKLTPSVVADKLSEAQQRLDENARKDFDLFVQQANIDQLDNRAVYHDRRSVGSALNSGSPMQRVRVNLGICLAAANNSKGEDSAIGCWNGGVEKYGAKIVYTHVPNGDGNCVRCRWLLTGPEYIDSLRGHFNQISYQITMIAESQNEIQKKIEMLEDQRYDAEQSGKAFKELYKLKELQARGVAISNDLNESVGDLRATWTIINQLVSLNQSGNVDGSKQIVLALGGAEDIKEPLSLISSDNELLQLCELCLDAEVIPSLLENLVKSPAIEKRSRLLNKMLMREGYRPIFMELDQRQQLAIGNALTQKMALKFHGNMLDGLERLTQAINDEISLSEELKDAADELMISDSKSIPLFQTIPCVVINE